jgi:anion transporter
MLYLLGRNKYDASVVFLGAVSVLLTFKIISVKEVASGFSNEGMLTVACLFIIAGVIKNSPTLSNITNRILKDNDSERKALIKLSFPIVVMSAFLNNTPIVALFIPIIKKWSKRNNFSASKFLIPLSYLSIFGGIVTLIGTSTNLLISSMIVNLGYKPIGMFEITKIGVPLAFVGVAYLVFYGKKMLPNNKNMEYVEKEEISISSFKEKILIGCFLLIIILPSLNIIPILHACILSLSIIFFTNTISLKKALKSIGWDTLLVISLSFSIGSALINSGASEFISRKIIEMSGFTSPVLLLMIVYVVTNIFTNIITNNAAAVLVLPIAYNIVSSLNLDMKPFAIAIAISASSSFVTHFGYQTNLMVYKEGNYSFKDYIRIGLPLNILFFIVSISLILVFYKLN